MKPRISNAVLSLATAGLLFSHPAVHADTVTFLNGEKLSGKVVSEQTNSITFDSDAIGRIEIPRERVQSVQLQPAVPATPEETAGTTNTPPRGFLRFYSDKSLRYEFVQPLRISDPFKPGTNYLVEQVGVRGRFGTRGSFDAAAFASGDGQRQASSDVEVRTLRLYTSGEFGFRRTNEFKLDLGIADKSFYLHEAYIRAPKLPYVGDFTFGYATVPQTLENIQSFGSLTFMEASSPGLAFGPGNRVGFNFRQSFWQERATTSFGLYSVGLDPDLNFGDSSDALARPTLRITGLASENPEADRWLHLGGSAAFVFSDSAEIEYKARPESHLAPVLVDTGLLESRFAYIGGLEAIYHWGPLTFQGELMGSIVDADQDYAFWGGYVSAGWFLTGEKVQYDRAEGVVKPVRPNHNLSFKEHTWGAVQVGLRLSYLDLQDNGVDGGRMLVLMPGVNWYWSRHFRWQLNYGFSHVEDGPSPGNLNVFQVRAQVSY